MSEFRWQYISRPKVHEREFVAMGWEFFADSELRDKSRPGLPVGPMVILRRPLDLDNCLKGLTVEECS